MINQEYTHKGKNYLLIQSPKGFLLHTYNKRSFPLMSHIVAAPIASYTKAPTPEEVLADIKRVVG